MRYILAVVLTLAFVGLTATASIAEVRRDNDVLYVTGATTKWQVTQAVGILSKHYIKRVVLFGPGGDFFGGLALGQAIKKEGAVVQIPTNTRCVSACAFAAMGGYNILVGGELWFHHAYRPMYEGDASLEEINKSGQIIGMTTLYYGYLQDIPASFMWEVVATTSSCKFLIIDNTKSMRTIMDGKFDDKVVVPRRHHSTCHNSGYTR